MKITPYLLALLVILTTACSAIPRPTEDISAIVNSTLTAFAQQQGNAQASRQQPVATDIPPSSPLVVNPTDPDATPGYDYFPPKGTITGSLSYPSSFIPPMRVVVFNLNNELVAYTDTTQNQGTYTFDLPEGIYHVVAYPYDQNAAGVSTTNTDTFAGGYTAAVPCGLSVNCTDHSLLNITVVAGQTANADPGDWYAPPGSFPPMPNQ